MDVQDFSDNRLHALLARWNEYAARGTFEHFIEFALALNSFTEHARRLKLPGVVRLCEGLEHTTLALYGDTTTHPIPPNEIAILQRQVEIVSNAVTALQLDVPGLNAVRADVAADDKRPLSTWQQPRVLYVVSDADHPWVLGIEEQFAFFGFSVTRFSWDAPPKDVPTAMVLLLIPPQSGYEAREYNAIKHLRHAYPASQLFCLAVPKSLPTMVQLLRAGADVTIHPDEEMTTVLSRVLELIQHHNDDPARVLVVEDSTTAMAFIQRALSDHGIGSHAITNPQQLIAAIEMYQPDLVLMDMYMPHCSGVEATRVMRQLAAYQSLPVVYLSSEKDMEMQIDALRLGGDQFLTKPCNPLLLSAVVRTKIERYREMQRSSLHDGLTGLLNHSASKTRLTQLIHALNRTKDRLCVGMIDIDHFKSINDIHGHPVGDQVIRSLAWLLKARLRATDIVGRYGGEEFLVVLRDSDQETALNVIERIRLDFASMPHVHAEGTLRATFSAGISVYPMYESITDLTKAADDALYEAKRAGRNRVVCAR
jgi:diguanylate cyclase (GGDEF)-like protein